ncbi:DNA-binding protein Alba [Candidatus Bathyarchaeota archaeon]|nr:DNA-binding protein Alba [Candidatus Bathyarchaeota archaeon]
MKDENTVYIGSKPPMAYVMAMITAFNRSGADSVVLKARGRAISRAVDVAEIARGRYLNDLKAEKIEIGSEQMPTEDGRTRGVSTIAITLRKGGEAAVKAEAPPEPVEEPKPVEEIKEEPEPEPPTKVKAAPKIDVGLSDIKGVGKTTVEKLAEAGYKSPKSIARAKPSTLSEKTGLSEKVATKIIDAAKELLNS